MAFFWGSILGRTESYFMVTSIAAFGMLVGAFGSLYCKDSKRNVEVRDCSNETPPKIADDD